jgi:hypothetical protein
MLAGEAVQKQRFPISSLIRPVFSLGLLEIKEMIIKINTRKKLCSKYIHHRQSCI